jgi:hypothetical protein
MQINSAANSKKVFLFLKILILVLPIIILANNLWLLWHNCVGATDFSIYQQAIYDMAANLDLNPFITIRNVKIFNDHFDPVIILLAPILRIANYSPSALIFFEWMMFYFLLFYIVFREQNISLNHRYLLAFILLFEKGVLTALNYPIHPTTWSIVPIYFCIRSLVLDQTRPLIIWSFCLLFFKESFCFSIIGIGVAKCILKRWRVGVPLLLMGFASALFNFHFRKVFFGDLVSYGSNLLGGYVSNPIDSIKKLILGLNYKEMIKLFIASITLLLSSIYLEKKRGNERLLSVFIGVMSFFLPLFGIQFLANKFYFHYCAQLILPLVVFSIFILKEVDKRHVLIALIFLVTGMGRYTKNVRSIVKEQKEECLLTKENRDEISKVNKMVLEKIKSGKTLFVTAGIPPLLLKPNLKVYQSGYYSEKLKHHDYMLIQMNRHGNTSPYSPEKINKFVSNCKSLVQKIIYETDNFFFAKGVPEQCLEPFYRSWSVHH